MVQPTLAIRDLGRNAAWNLWAQVLPVVAALVAIPTLVANLGESRFGFLSIAYVIVGYFGVLDFGMSRSLTRSIARRLGPGGGAGVQELASTGLVILVAFGVALSPVVFWAGSLWNDTLHFESAQLASEAGLTIWILAAAVPVIMAYQGLRGIVEAWGLFRASAVVKVAVGVATFALPQLISSHMPTLWIVVASIVAVRAAGVVAFAILVTARTRLRLSARAYRRVEAAELIHFGLWVSVSNFISPVMVYFDRFLVGYWISLAAVTPYAVAFDVLTKALVVPAAVAGAMFPSIAWHDGRGAKDHGELIRKSLLYSMAPLCAGFALAFPFYGRLLEAWLGANLAAQVLPVAQVLALGVLLNAAAHIPFAVIQARGDAKSTACLHLAELPLYVAMLYFLVERNGIVGAAIAWTARAGIDLFALTLLMRRARAVDTRAAETMESLRVIE